MGFDWAFGDEIKTVFVSEWDEKAQETYTANFGNNPPVQGDITKIDAKDVPLFDICLAGFPCQAFSIAGRKQGFNDDWYGQTRGTLFRDVVRICARHRPKIIFCENVPGLYRHDSGNTFTVIEGAFKELGYTVFTDLLNSKNFGLPQNRERLYFVCFRNDLAPAKFEFPKTNGRRASIRDILDDAPISAKYYLSEGYLKTLRLHKERHKAKGNGFGYVVRDLDDVAGAIVVGGMGRERNLIIDERPHPMKPTTGIKTPINKENIRRMTPREWARLQGFPDSYVLSVADTHLYKQLGNSVSVPVIQAIAGAIKQHLDSGES